MKENENNWHFPNFKWLLTIVRILLLSNLKKKKVTIKTNRLQEKFSLYSFVYVKVRYTNINIFQWRCTFQVKRIVLKFKFTKWQSNCLQINVCFQIFIIFELETISGNYIHLLLYQRTWRLLSVLFVYNM